MTSRHEEFALRLAQATPRTWAIGSIVAVNVLIWLAMITTGSGDTSASPCRSPDW